jgi:hypothetical protein
LAGVQDLLVRRGIELSEERQRELLSRIKDEAEKKRKISEEWVVSLARELDDAAR